MTAPLAAQLRGTITRVQRLAASPARDRVEIELAQIADMLEGNFSIEAPPAKPKRNIARSFHRGTVTGAKGNVVKVDFRGRRRAQA